MATKRIAFKVKGLEMLQHNVRLANPLDEHAKAMKKVSAKRKKTDDDHVELARLEFMGGGYWDGKNYFIPAATWRAAIVEGAKKVKLGKAFLSTVMPVKSTPIKCDGPKTPDERWEAGCYDQSAVKVGTSRVIRTRPLFRNWSATVEFQYDSDVVDGDQIEAAMRTTGSLIGIGDYRPFFGKFDVEEVPLGKLDVEEVAQ